MANEKQYEYVLPEGYVLNSGTNEYVIEDVLGKGGYAITYKVKAQILVENIPFDLHFALKEYFPETCWRESDDVTIAIPKTMQDEIKNGLKDFINEGKKLKQVCKLNHNIVNVNEVFEANGTAYYVLEYLNGGDLRKIINDNGAALTEQQMLDVMVPIGHALQCLHDKYIIHLDVKPDNIVMRRDPHNGKAEPVLIDFGIAEHFNKDGTPTTKTPTKGISPGYSPIEQYSQIKRFDPRLDVYAFSATCLYLLTGRNPIEATDMPNDFVKNELPAGIGSNVALAIEHGMCKDKEARIGSINEVLALLTGDIDDIESLPSHDKNNDKPHKKDYASKRHKPMPTVTPQSAKPKPSKLRRNSLIVLSIVLIAALIAALVLLSKRCDNKHGNNNTLQLATNIINGNDSTKSDYLIDYTNVQTFKVGDVSFNMVKVDGGTFEMGATKAGHDTGADRDETPAHKVTLTSYYIGQTEVTQELWQAVMGNNPSDFKGSKKPVENVSWDDCQVFIKKLNEKTGKSFRLPTEAEWEYAARGGNRSNHYNYCGSNNINEVAWYDTNAANHPSESEHCTHNVATKKPNELGIYDMSGNVIEWCSDWYGENYYKNSPSHNPQGPNAGTIRTHRGGSWYYPARNCRVSNRAKSSPKYHTNLIGLRLAL